MSTLPSTPLERPASPTAAGSSALGLPVVVPAVPHDVFGMLFVPPSDQLTRVPLVLCSPFGWEDVSSHRALRAWAQHLAERGYPTLRIDLPGTGDSAGDPRDPELVPAWTAGIAAAARWLAERYGTPDSTVLGVGLSGLLAMHAAMTTETSGIGDLALWGTPARGRTVVRQLRAFARMEQESGGVDADGERIVDDPPTEDPRLAPGGFLLTDETQAALRAIDLTSALVPTPPGRVLLLERDGLPVDARLQTHLEASGVAVTAMPGDGYGPMTGHPETAVAPPGAMQTVDTWLDLNERLSTPPPPSPSPEVPPTLHLDGVRETSLPPVPGGPQTFALLAEPTRVPPGAFTAVFLNAGAMRRIGPNRMWTEASRRWAAAGIPCARLDVGSLGDAPGPVLAPITVDALHDPRALTQLRATLDRLQHRGLPSRFILIGLCAGSWMAFSVAGHDPRVEAAILLNPRALIWSPHLLSERDARVGKRIVRGSQWARILRGEIGLARILSVLTAILRYPIHSLRRRRHRQELFAAFRRIEDAQVRMTLAFTSGEPLHAELEGDEYRTLLNRSPHLTVVEIPGRDHTLRPLPEQDRAHAVLDAELGRLLRASDKR